MFKMLLVTGLLVSTVHINANYSPAGVPSKSPTPQSSLEESNPSFSLELLAKVPGVEIGDKPVSGCSDSALPPHKVQELLRGLEEPTRGLLSRAFDSSSAVWAIQLYMGADGTGFCFPEQNKMVRLTALKLAENNSKPNISERIGAFIRDIGKAIPKWFAPSS